MAAEVELEVLVVMELAALERGLALVEVALVELD